ncbi:hypothetical protein BV25DRAFT_1831220 [Artomyces pyxidatus]|uniref:Uncharacterized protein n=1 Tax=Artomyces pyxidatus TaxID=48021 RepID=A0ACB8SNS8_9AGAM|nr:hypothetical protein BV25DRAFT_1831220 [Artomyces pyxidatus]
MVECVFPLPDSGAIIYKNIEDVDVASARYHVPAATDNPLFDAFFISRGKSGKAKARTLWICRMITAKRREGPRGGYSLISQLRRRIAGRFKCKVEVKYALVMPLSLPREYHWDLPVGWSEPGVKGDVYCLPLVPASWFF